MTFIYDQIHPFEKKRIRKRQKFENLKIKFLRF